MRIAYLEGSYAEGQRFATSSIAPSLTREFGRANVRAVTSENLLDAARDPSVDMLVLPGITGESSPYPDIIPPRKAEVIYARMQEGLIVMAECAAFYWSAREISYVTSDGRKLQKTGLGWVDGVARGPWGKAIAPDADFRYADTIATDIEFYDGMNAHQTAICISNGPALYLSEQETENPDVHITSRFIAEPGRPVATMTKMIGDGMLVGMGVLPHIQTPQLQGRQQDSEKERHRAALFNTIAANEAKIQHFERMVFGDIRHHQMRTLHPSSDMRIAL